MNFKRLNYTFALLIVIGMVSCSDNDTVSPGKNASLTLKASSNQLKVSHELMITEALIQVESAEFESLEQGDDDDFEIDFKGPFEINLLTGSSTPEIPTAYLVPGKYEEVELELNQNQNPNLIITGTVALAGAAPIEFEFYGYEDLEFESEGENTELGYLFEVKAGDKVDIVMTFDVESWFANVDILSGEQKDGVIEISKTSNLALYAQIIQNIDEEKLIVSTGN